MTQEEKDLLLKDLCGRLPYGVHILYDNTEVREMGLGSIHDFMFDSAEVKPYLRTMPSMTEKERKEYKDMNVLDNCDEFSNIKKNIEDIKKNGEENYIQLPRTHAQDYLNSIHVDYRGLIEKGLALEAPEGMYAFIG